MEVEMRVLTVFPPLGRKAKALVPVRPARNAMDEHFIFDIEKKMYKYAEIK